MARLSDERDRASGWRGLDGWERDGRRDRASEFERGDFAGSVGFVNRITPVAEEMNHHPDLAISWNKVTVTITNHSEGGLTGPTSSCAHDDRGRCRRLLRGLCYGRLGRRMSDDEPPRSSGARPHRPSGMTELLFLVGVVVLVASTASSSRPSSRSCARATAKLEAMPRRARAAPRWRCTSSTTSTSTCRRASSASRWPRSASASSASPRSPALHRGRVRRGVLARRGRGDLVRVRLPGHHALHITIGEQVPKIYAIIHAGEHRAAGRAAAASCSG